MYLLTSLYPCVLIYLRIFKYFYSQLYKYSSPYPVVYLPINQLILLSGSFSVNTKIYKYLKIFGYFLADYKENRYLCIGNHNNNY